MPIPKRKVYGQSQTTSCLFCGDQATSATEQGAPCCRNHSTRLVPDLKCLCGGWLDVRSGKWGVYWLCSSCGIMNRRKVMELHGDAIRSYAKEQSKERERSVRSSDGKLPLDRIREKVKKGIPLTLDELDML